MGFLCLCFFFFFFSSHLCLSLKVPVNKTIYVALSLFYIIVFLQSHHLASFRYSWLSSILEHCYDVTVDFVTSYASSSLCFACIFLFRYRLIFPLFTAKNPPPICAGLPYVKLADICLSFRNLTWTNSSLSGCVWIEAELEHVTIGEKKLGCFKMPLGEEMLVSGVMPGAENRMGEVLPKKKRNGSLYFKSLKSKTKVDRYDTASRIRDGRLGF